MNSSLSRTLARHASSIYFKSKKRTDKNRLGLIYKLVLGRSPTLQEQSVVLPFPEQPIPQEKPKQHFVPEESDSFQVPIYK
jgi:hypothetical protein